MVKAIKRIKEIWNYLKLLGSNHTFQDKTIAETQSLIHGVVINIVLCDYSGLGSRETKAQSPSTYSVTG